MKLKEETLSLMTKRQRAVAEALLDNCVTYEDIAKRLNISKKTVQTHLGYIYNVCNVSGKTELIQKAARGEI